MLNKFWDWYNRHYVFNVAIAAFLFLWQLVHLFWLSTHVVSERLFGASYFELEGIWQYIIVLVDYTEIPAIILTSIIYINELRKKFSWKSILFLAFLNSQWLHIFWITDEYVLHHFSAQATSLVMPIWLSWIAIFIDYLEIPVIFDTIRKAFLAVKEKLL